jgi:hypothetical protein
MKATYDPTAKTSYTTSHRRESAGLHQEFSMLIPSQYRPGEAQSIVTLRVYWPGSVCYACLWVNADPVHTQGSGKAGGYGYCKASSAAGQAIRNAGFQLEHDIDGVGLNAIRDAMKALAVELGHPEALLHEAYA